ncbi:hypothetical protein T4D_2647 [Trichinella pseudospiralis]|uniref:Transmembrane protein n=1 Tax=Trichinella pseudospiralis TaxID=6337 RepID=A0A0V1FP23_TRIPS|nr:hypothetical protein T4D_2647 [Trichinella pseudospiralis]
MRLLKLWVASGAAAFQWNRKLLVTFLHCGADWVVVGFVLAWLVDEAKAASLYLCSLFYSLKK